MNRRDAVQYISLLLGGTIVGAGYFLEGCKSKTGMSTDFTPETIAWLDEVADIILPATKTPGAKAAKVGQFMTVMVNDCYEAPDQKIFHDGISKLDEASNKKNGKSFMDSSPQERHDLLVELDKNANDGQKAARDYYNSLSDEQKHEMALKKDKEGSDPMADKYRENPYYYFI
ncbi:MAG: gluconate 2-dehydrogenase subunit 3 family protein, partial [Ginsengibacter sp.]